MAWVRVREASVELHLNLHQYKLAKQKDSNCMAVIKSSRPSLFHDKTTFVLDLVETGIY